MTGECFAGVSVESMSVDLRVIGGRNWRLLVTDTESTKEQSMNFQKWEATIYLMIEESNREAKEPGKNRVLTEWRATLTKTPHNLQPFQIDEIVREVRRRLTTSPQHSSNSHTQFNPAPSRVMA